MKSLAIYIYIYIPYLKIRKNDEKWLSPDHRRRRCLNEFRSSVKLDKVLWSLGVSTRPSMTTTRPHLGTTTCSPATSYGWASASIRDTESVCELYPCSICAILLICQLLPGRGLVLHFILHIFLLDLTYSNEMRLNLVEEMRRDCSRGAPTQAGETRAGKQRCEGIAEDRGRRRPYIRSRCSRSISSDGRWCRCAIGCGESQRDPFVSAENWKIGNHLCSPSPSSWAQSAALPWGNT